MKCPNCGKDNRDGAGFCISCGTRFTDQKPAKEEKLPEKKGFSITGAVGAIIKIFLYIMLMNVNQIMVTAYYMSGNFLGNPEFVQAFLSGSQDELDRIITSLLPGIAEKAVAQSVTILLIANLLTVLMICLFFRIRKKEPKKELGVNHINIMSLPTYALYGTALNIFVSVTLSIIPLPDSLLAPFENQYASFFETGNIFVEIFSVAVVTAITEEIIFRAISLKRLLPHYGKVLGIAISAVLFGLVHGALIAVVYATVLGVIFAAMDVKKRSIIPSVVVHMFFNLTPFWLESVPQSQGFMLILYLVSIIAVVYCTYRVFFAKPTFYDVLSDVSGAISPENSEQARVIDELQKMTEEGMIDRDRLEELYRMWENASGKTDVKPQMKVYGGDVTSPRKTADESPAENRTEENPDAEESGESEKPSSGGGESDLK